MNLTKFSIEDIIGLTIASLLILAVSFFLFTQSIKYKGKKFYYNWVMIFGASIFGIVGLILFGMPIYSIIINK
jgi:hypothetical protein